MRLGIITDIHEQVDNLKRAFAEFDARNIEQIVCLGDLMLCGDRIRETVALLAARNVPGVWGNHDFGLCSHPSALRSSRRAQYAGPVLDYLATYQPYFEIEDCGFSHVEPWRDLNNVTELWHFGEPFEPTKSFDACAQRVLFTGHLHSWKLATRAGVRAWDGAICITLAPPEHFFVVVAALCDGWCATYDTRSHVLTPIQLRETPR